MSEKDDVGHILLAVEAARRVLDQYISPGPRNAVDTVDRLIDILDERDLIATLDRLRHRKGHQADQMNDEDA